VAQWLESWALNSVQTLVITILERKLKNKIFTFFRFTFKLQRPPPSSQMGDTTVYAAENNMDSINTNSTASIPNTTTEKQQQQEDFDYNSFVLQEEDSETEEFVNIVVNEFATEITNDEAEKLINEMKEMKRSSLVPPSDTAAAALNGGFDSVDRSTPIPITIEDVDDEATTKNNSSLTNPKRSFSFFKRNKNNNNSSSPSLSPSLSSLSTKPNASSIRRRSTPDTSLLGVQEYNRKQVFEGSLNFEPNTTPVVAARKKEVRITEPLVDSTTDAITKEGEIEEGDMDNPSNTNETAKSKRDLFRRKVSEATMEWDNISQHNLLDAINYDTVQNNTEEEKEPTGQRTSHQNANKVRKLR